MLGSQFGQYVSKKLAHVPDWQRNDFLESGIQKSVAIRQHVVFLVGGFSVGSRYDVDLDSRERDSNSKRLSNFSRFRERLFANEIMFRYRKYPDSPFFRLQNDFPDRQHPVGIYGMKM